MKYVTAKPTVIKKKNMQWSLSTILIHAHTSHKIPHPSTVCKVYQQAVQPLDNSGSAYIMILMLQIGN